MAFKKTTLKNGLRIITAPMQNSPTATALVLVETGSKYEDKRTNGLAHFLEHMCFKGTKNRPTAMDITKELDGLGAQSNAFTGQEYTGYFAKAQAENLPELIDIVSDVYLNSTFDKNEIEKEKGVIVQEINMFEDNPSRHVYDIFMKVLYGDQPAGWFITGLKEEVVKLTREDFLSYRSKHYLASSTIVMVAGGFNEEEIIKLIEQKFSQMETGEKVGKLPIKEAQDTPQILLKHKDTDQTHLMMGVRSKNIFDDDTYTLDVLGGVLGGGMSSRLFQKIREEMGAAYRVMATNDAYTDHGAFIVYVGSDNKKVFDVISTVLNEFKRISEELVPEDELAKVKRYLTGHLFLDVESTDSLANFLGLQEVLTRKILTPEEVAKKIKAVTAKDIKRVAKEIFKNERLNMALIGPYTDKKDFEKIFRF